MTAPILLWLRDRAAVFEGPLAQIVFDHAILAPALHTNVVAGSGWHLFGIVVWTPAMLATETVRRLIPQRKRSLHGKNARAR